MKKPRFAGEQIAHALKRVALGMAIGVPQDWHCGCDVLRVAATVG